MAKILSQAGISLADIYDVVGSIAGVEELLSEEISLIHEMGSTVFSERLRGTIQRATTGALAQNVVWNLTIPHPGGIYRILGVYVQADVSSRTQRAQISLRSVEQGREIPLFIWDSTGNDFQSSIQIVEEGAAVSTDSALIQISPQMGVPTIATGAGQPAAVGDEIIFRGITGGFGAGTVTNVALIHMVSAESASFIAVGLPIPGW